MQKIVLTGPESTGKTTLAQLLADQYRVDWVPEYARNFLEGLNRPYRESDLLDIAKGQLQLEEEFAAKANPFLFCDTGMLVLKIWSEFKYGRCHPWILEQWETRHYDLYLLCGTDTNWEFDPLREHPNQREELYFLYKKALIESEKPFMELSGSLSERCQKVLAHIE